MDASDALFQPMKCVCCDPQSEYLGLTIRNPLATTDDSLAAPVLMAAAEDDVLRQLLDAALLHPTHEVPIQSFQVRRRSL